MNSSVYLKELNNKKLFHVIIDNTNVPGGGAYNNN